MRLRFGRHRGLTLEVVLLRYPDYVLWMLRHAGDGAVARAFEAMIRRFDRLPFSAPCTVCGWKASRAWAYPGSTRLLCRCGTCAPYPDRLGSPVMTLVMTFAAAMAHIEQTVPRGRRRAARRIMRELVIARGGPRRVTEAAAGRFVEARGSLGPQRGERQELGEQGGQG